MILAVLVLTVGGYLFVSESQQQGQQSIAGRFAYLQNGSQCLQLAVADTPEKRRQGLSGRKQLKSDEGMLFTYDKPGRYGFWMKDMNFPIDIIWLDGNNQVVSVKRNAQPESFPQSFKPDSPAKNVIETPARWAAKQDIKTGDQMTLVGPTTTTPGGCGSD